MRSVSQMWGLVMSLIILVGGRLKSMGGRLPACSAESVHKRAGTELPDELKPALLPVLETIASITQEIRRYDQRIETLASERYPETNLLRQVSGGGGGGGELRADGGGSAAGSQGCAS